VLNNIDPVILKVNF